MAESTPRNKLCATVRSSRRKLGSLTRSSTAKSWPVWRNRRISVLACPTVRRNRFATCSQSSLPNLDKRGRLSYDDLPFFFAAPEGGVVVQFGKVVVFWKPIVSAKRKRGSPFGPRSRFALTLHCTTIRKGCGVGFRRVPDAYICMYHDQGLIPLKALAFDSAVNVTLGLPIVRTSVDHGTALDIAWQGQADCSSMIAAVKLAAKIALGTN